MHLPLAADIARTSAELVAGDTPAMTWADPTAQVVWDDISQCLGWANTLLEAAEVAAALGGVYLRPQWDMTVADHPFLTVVRPDEALPTFRFGCLASVTFATVLENDGRDVLRWLEHHEPGQIRHELWRGTPTSIGRPIPLVDHEATRHLVPVIDTERILGRRGLLVQYIPNDTPNPLVRLPLGRADVQGAETLLDALDEAWDSWMRDIRLGKARLVVAADYLDAAPRDGAGGRWFGRRRPAKTFDLDAEVFTPLPGLDVEAVNDKTPGITPVQFALRVEEHRATVAQLVEEIISRCGYAPQTFGLHVEGQLSGTAIRRREHRSYRTRDRKRRYARPALEQTARVLLAIHRVVFGAQVPDERPTLEWRETGQADPLETAQVVELLRRAEVVSDEVAVRMAHPEWDEDQVATEVRRLADRRRELTAPAATGFEPVTDADTTEDEEAQP